MARKTKLPPKPIGGFRHPWYLGEWLEASENMSQAELGRKTELGKATISDLVNGKLQYSQTHLDLISIALNVRPYELLMPPAEAAAIRKIVAGHEELEALRSQVPEEPAAIRIWRKK